ncbi:MAG: hypothetical protein FWE28_00080 [Oscillospiraceae bacterium]|nr:hypothetical protein [Oscillospiraceae bacterium]
MKKRILLLALALLCVVALGACGGSDPETDIIGTWQCLDNTQPHQWMCTLIFEEGGRFVDRDGDEGDFIIDGDTLTLDFDGFGPFEVTFRLRGNRLTIEAGDDLGVMLTRQ